ncbi:Phosphatidylinositol N-acetylglucosaminyltransferase subunit GPI1 [Wickerhamomyces ciferrii]|uniref:Phosphatidylinositol N-acetylglucosaminyltransferase subunit GPI1 n=1 Tax=Wickerhamomyces ciferrii (strain ATCC 14091 / BCRC 22168 / CBS 111 / JCM 3599 / NBRC 0793 / NRRL Y-1031 F-60-10) TaxID=1206466 RepID=K0KJZ9_WICCF|nr:Phosphatidylinositol N-acetylglucosaminyltransferase subunit GPI1 [Wickerhamomyces ciferrii]CCH41453.1 Phosphatidylinositol N-acetylglucosaminyltransferase subunit GPI1 [Wickerhamomyces ciferrii]
MHIQVFWPSDLIQTEEYIGVNTVVIGHNIEEQILVVVATLHYNQDKELIDRNILDENRNIQKFNDHLEVVGVIGEASWWNGTTIEIHNGQLYMDSSRIVVYDPPNPTMMQFFSVKPISVSLPEHEISLTSKDSQVDHIKDHVAKRSYSTQEKHFQDAIRCLNSCWRDRRELLETVPKMQSNWENMKSWNNTFQKVYELIFVILNSFRNIPLKNYIRFISLHIIIFTRSIFMIIIRLLNGRFSPDLPSLVELSATAQQIDLRLQQFCYAPIQYIRTKRKIDWSIASLRHLQSPVENSLPIEQYPEYIRFYNTLWLVINDVTFGITIGALLLEHQRTIVESIDKILIWKILYSDLKKISMWLMNSPGGIKLNTELSIFFSELFTWMVEFWKLTLINTLQPNLLLILKIAAFSSTFGATFPIAIFADFLSVITFHIYCFYFASARIFNWQLGILNSLFNLFLGRKRNVLRNRIDSNDYDLDQLLLGTLLFTVVSFLLPTVFAFYMTFTITSLLITVIISSLELTMSCLNHFPIFVMLLRIKDHKRTPGGIVFKNYKGYLKIESKPLRIGRMFEPFKNVISKLNSLYLSPKTIQTILSGHPISVKRNKFYKMLYSALPAEPIENSEVWKAIS